MRNCFYIPRLLVPGKERQNWSVIACDRYQNERSYWENQASVRGAIPSALNFILPEVYLGENDEERIARIREEMYAALEADWLEKLTRGLVLTERTSARGTRRGIVAAIDLECFAQGGEEGQIRCIQRAPEALIDAYLSQRAHAPIEMPHTVILYDDPKNRAVNLILEEENEELYDYEVEGGRLRGYFLPEDFSEEVCRELLARSEQFYVLEGVAAAEAAKRHWQKVKAGLTKGEMGRHPARFMLAEFMNIQDEEVEILPVHRLVKETDAEAFCDYFCKKFKCERKGRLLTPKLAFSKENVGKIDEEIERFLRADGGKRVFVRGAKRLEKYAQEEDAAGVLMPCPQKGSLVKELRAGAVFAENTLSLGGEKSGRYYVETREISYD